MSFRTETGSPKRWPDFRVAVSIALAAIAVLYCLKQLAVAALITGDGVTYGTIFAIGIVASVSPCLAILAGLILSITLADRGAAVRSQVAFHIGRLAAFFVFGGLLWVVGDALELGDTGAFTLNIAVSIVMLILSANLFDILRWPGMRSPLVGRTVETKPANHLILPLAAGAITFFLSSGYTQVIHVFALSSSSFMDGALRMFIFALGTLPMAVLISFASLRLRGQAKEWIFLTAAGLTVMLLALINLMSAFVLVGFLSPVFDLWAQHLSLI